MLTFELEFHAIRAPGFAQALAQTNKQQNLRNTPRFLDRIFSLARKPADEASCRNLNAY